MMKSLNAWVFVFLLLLIWIFPSPALPLAATGRVPAPSRREVSRADLSGKTVEVSLAFREENLRAEAAGVRQVVRMGLRNCHLEGEPGQPLLPRYYLRILIPGESDYAGLQLNKLSSRLLPGEYEIIPAPAEVPLSYRGPYPPLKADKEIYSLDTKWPAEPVEYVYTGIRRGHKYLVFRVAPLQYVPSRGELYLNFSVPFTVRLAEGGVRPVRYSHSAPVFRRLVEEAVVNPGDRALLYPEPEQAPLSTDVDYLIITSAALSSAFQELADWKEEKGLAAEVVTTSDIYAGYSGNDDQEKIKACIVDYAANRNTVWVLLGGDSEVVPDRDCYCQCGSYSNSSLPSDIYYAGLDDMEWNDDADSYPCEPSAYGDSIDLEPDVFVGRAAVRTAAQAVTFIEKVKKYVDNPPSNDFAEKMILMGVELWNTWDGRSDADWRGELMYDDYIAPYWAGDKYRLYDTNTDFAGGASYQVTDDHLQDQINAGYNFIFMATHGGTTSWSMEEGVSFSSTDVTGLTNADAQGLVYTIACHTNAFDRAEPSLSEAFVRQVGGGAVSYIGSSHYGWGTSSPLVVHGSSFKYAREFYRHLFTGQPADYLSYLGAVHAEHKIYWSGSSTSYGSKRWLQFSLNLIGDPQMKIMVADPIPPTPTPVGYSTPTPSHPPTPSPSSTPTPEAYQTPTPTASPSPTASLPPSPSPTPEGLVCYLDLGYSTYLGGSGDDYTNGMALGGDSCSYIAGYTTSADFPLLNSYQSAPAGAYDLFVAKLSSSGSGLLYATYLGGSADDGGYDLSVDSAGCAYVAGYTASTDAPNVNSYQPDYGGGTRDAFLVKLSTSGSSLIFATYLGGADYEYSSGVALDSGCHPYLTGYTRSSNFPTVNAFQGEWNPGTDGSWYDVFVTKFSSSGSALSYSTFLGGKETDYGRAIAVDESGCAYITGSTNSPDFPTRNSFQGEWNPGTDTSWYDAFISKLSSSGSALIYSSYLGGERTDIGWAVEVGPEECAYLAGYTASFKFPTRNPYQSSFVDDFDIFAAKISPSGQSLLYSTYLGGDGTDYGKAIAVDTAGCAYLGGYSYSSDFPTANPYQPARAGNWDVVAVKLSATGSSLVYSTFLGGSSIDMGFGLALDGENRVYLAGRTKSDDFPLRNPYQTTLAGEYDVFVSRLEWISYLITPTPTPRPTATPTTTPSPSPPPTSTPTPSPSSPPSPPPSSTPTPSPSPSSSVLPTPTCGPALPRNKMVLESGDYDGDGVSDVAVFRDTSGLWAVKGITTVYFGQINDRAVPGDYDGDATTDIGIFRGATGLWAIRGLSRTFFGAAGDLPVPGDYDGDGKAEIGIFRESYGLWAIKGLTRTYYGMEGDWPLPGNYDGEERKTIGIYRPSSGLWAVRELSRIYYGSESDWPVPGDYDGDATWEMGIYRPSTGLWAIRGVSRIYFGNCADRPLPADYDGDTADEPGIFRGTSGLWALPGLTRVYFGASGDFPVTR